MDDLRDLAENGLTDLFEYGQDFVVGNALGDGSKKDDNSTAGGRERTETFAEKYRRELKKDLDELGLDDEDENAAESAGESEASTEDSEPEGFIDLDALTKTEEEAEEEDAAAAPDDKGEGEKADL